MPAAWAGIGLQGLSMLGNAFGSSNNSEAAAQAQRNAMLMDMMKQQRLYEQSQQALALINQQQGLHLTPYQLKAYSPELLQGSIIPNPRLLEVDQTNLNSRMKYLKMLEAEAANPGMSAGDKVLLDQASRPAANAILRAQGQQDENIRARMNGGDAGTEYLLGNQSNQQAGDTLANIGAQAFGNSYNAKLNALGGLAGQYANLQHENEARTGTNNGMLNARDFNQYLQNQQIQQANVGAKNSAQQYNLANETRITGLNNANKTAENASYNNLLSSKANAIMGFNAPYNQGLSQQSAAFGSQAAGYGALSSAQDAAMWGGLGKIGQGFMNPNSTLAQTLNGWMSRSNYDRSPLTATGGSDPEEDINGALDYGFE